MDWIASNPQLFTYFFKQYTILRGRLYNFSLEMRTLLVIELTICTVKQWSLKQIRKWYRRKSHTHCIDLRLINISSIFFHAGDDATTTMQVTSFPSPLSTRTIINLPVAAASFNIPLLQLPRPILSQC